MGERSCAMLTVKRTLWVHIVYLFQIGLQLNACKVQLVL